MNRALPPAVTLLFSHCLGSDLSPPASLMSHSGRISKMHMETYLFSYSYGDDPVRKPKVHVSEQALPKDGGREPNLPAPKR